MKMVKKVLALALSVALIGSLAACGWQHTGTFLFCCARGFRSGQSARGGRFRTGCRCSGR